MDRRLDLQMQLEALCSPYMVYYQPPESFRLDFPCAVYRRSDVDMEYANNHGYILTERYELTWLHLDPDDGMVERLLNSLSCVSYARQFALNGVYHDVMYAYK